MDRGVPAVEERAANEEDRRRSKSQLRNTVISYYIIT